jgi:PncC family amidohydrolase
MEKISLETRVGTTLSQCGLTIATAESCTGGLLGHRLTNVSGSSDYYRGGVISYSNYAKVELLAVDPKELQKGGAVSETVARQMAQGVRRLLNSDLGIGITGIAGPTGGTVEKPVGLVYIALAAETYLRCERHIWHEDRRGNKEASAARAMEMVLGFLSEKN